MKTFRYVTYSWDDAKAATRDPVERLVGAGDRALRELLLHFGELGADADLVAHRGRHGIGVHVGELRSAALEANRIRVGNVVADNIHALLELFQGADAGVERSEHNF